MRLNVLIEVSVVVLKRLVVGAFARSRPGEHGANQTREGAPHAAGGLDAFRCALGLAIDRHQPLPIHVDPHRQHVGRQHHIDCVGVARFPLRNIFAGGSVEFNLKL